MIGDRRRTFVMCFRRTILRKEKRKKTYQKPQAKLMPYDTTPMANEGLHIISTSHQINI